MKLSLLILALFLQNPLFASYNSKILKTKDYEEMRELLNDYIKKSQDQISDDEKDVDSAVSELKKGLKKLLMRPDTDAIKSSLILVLQNEVIKYRSFMAVFTEVIEESLKEFKDEKGSVAYQASLLYLIENSLSYLKSINNKESTKVLQKIKKAKLKISDEIFNYLLMEMGRGKTASPSYLAKQILKKRYKEQKKLAMKKAKEKKQAEKQAKKKKKKASEKKKREPSSVESKNSPKKTIEIDL